MQFNLGYKSNRTGIRKYIMLVSKMQMICLMSFVLNLSFLCFLYLMLFTVLKYSGPYLFAAATYLYCILLFLQDLYCILL
jgi:hypothetical protein